MTVIDFETATFSPPPQFHLTDGAAPAVRLRDVTHRYGRTSALEDLSFDLAPGSFTAVVGRQGSGKSALLRLLAGEESPPKGAETVIPKPSELLLPGAQLLPWQRVWGGVAEGLNRGWRSAGDAQRIASALSAVGLAEEARSWALKLSDEQTLRAGLARAVLRAPKLLLLDDAFQLLHARARAELQRLLLDLWREHRPTVLFATKDLNEALLLADRILVLEEGRLIADLTVDLARPRALIDPEFSDLRSKLLRILGHDFAATREQPTPLALEVFL